MLISLTLIFVAITVIISIKAWKDPALTNRWIFNPYAIKQHNQYYRFITSGFLHGGFVHLLFNMLVLYMFGAQVEAVYIDAYGDLGYICFGGLYLLGIIVSDIPTFLKYKDAPHYNALGASGGVSSILFSYILFDPSSKLYLYGLIGLPGVVWAALYIIYSYYMGKKQIDNVNHDAHLYGGVFGIVFTIITIPQIIPHFFEQLTELRLF
ncbi:MAG: rhomboid family intramembrane serine protease [Bacteroidota bacterium]